MVSAWDKSSFSFFFFSLSFFSFICIKDTVERLADWVV
jgi:hypothetical protein